MECSQWCLPPSFSRHISNWAKCCPSNLQVSSHHRSAASIPRTARSKTAGQAIVQPELRRVSGVLPSCCRKSAERVAILELRWTAENSWTLESVQKRGRYEKSGPRQSWLRWSRHTASTPTTSCLRQCFMVTPLRHRLDCFAFGA